MSEDGFREQMRRQRVGELIERTRAKHGGPIKPPPGSPGYIDALKAEILARPALVMTPELQERERALAGPRQAALARRASGNIG